MQRFPHTPRRHLIALAAGAALVLGIAQAQAQTPAPAPASATAAAPAAARLTIRDIYDRMEAAGYRDIREIEYRAAATKSRRATRRGNA